MVGFSGDQRRTLVEKLPDTANLALGVLVFGQLVTEEQSPMLAASGLGLWLLLMAFSLVLGRRRT